MLHLFCQIHPPKQQMKISRLSRWHLIAHNMPTKPTSAQKGGAGALERDNANAPVVFGALVAATGWLARERADPRLSAFDAGGLLFCQVRREKERVMTEARRGWEAEAARTLDRNRLEAAQAALAERARHLAGTPRRPPTSPRHDPPPTLPSLGGFPLCSPKVAGWTTPVPPVLDLDSAASATISCFVFSLSEPLGTLRPTPTFGRSVEDGG